MKKRFLIGMLLLGIFAANTVQAQVLSLQEEKIELDLPDVEEGIRVIYISDLHLISGNDLLKGAAVLADKQEEIAARYDLFSNAEYGHSEQFWDDLVETIDSYQADAVLFGADMVDYYSDENITLLTEGLNRLETPWMYIRADHDLGSWYADPTPSSKEIKAVEKAIDNYTRIQTMDIGNLRIIGVSNTTSQMGEKALGTFREAMDTNQNVLLMTHVPITPTEDTSLTELSKEAWGERDLTWGPNSSYVPDEITQEYLDLILSEESPVEAVVGGHLHLSWDGWLTESIREHVFDAAYKGIIGIIDIT